MICTMFFRWALILVLHLTFVVLIKKSRQGGDLLRFVFGGLIHA